MTDNSKLDRFIFYPIGIGIACLILAAVSGSQILAIIGSIGLLPLAGIMLFALVGGFAELLDDLLPEFQNKKFIVGGLVLIFAIIIIVGTIFGMGGSDPDGGCPMYRGVPTC